MQQGQAEQFGGRRYYQVDRPGAAVLAERGELALDLPGAGVRSVVHGHPAERGPQVVDHCLSVLHGPGAVAELQFGDRADGDQPCGDRLIPAEGLRARPHQQPGKRARVDEELRRSQRR
jgi:hypothetical protein